MTRERLEQLAEAKWALRRLQLKKSFYQFFIDSFPVITNGENLETNWHIEYLCNVLQSEYERWASGLEKSKDIIINVPPRTLKSSVASVAFPAWCWINSPSMKFIGSSYSSTLSIGLNSKTRRLIESNWYRSQFDVKLTDDQNAKGHFDLSDGGFRKATSTGGSITGDGGDCIIIDDPLNPVESNSKVQREEANEHFDNTLSTRLNDQKYGFFVVIMQRLHQNDLTGHLIKREPEKWEHICLPAEKSNQVRPIELSEKYVDELLFPQRLNKSVLSDLRVRLGSYNYAGQFKQLPADPEGGILKRAWFKIISYLEFIQVCEINRLTPVWEFYLDTAYTEDKANDPTAILCACEILGTLYVKHVSTRHLEFPELIKYIAEYVGAQGYTTRSRIYVEPKASGKSIVQQLKKSSTLNIIESDPPREDKVTRVTSISAITEAGRIVLIEGNWNDSYLDEICNFPKAEHDDQVDVTVMAAVKKLVQIKTGRHSSTLI